MPLDRKKMITIKEKMYTYKILRPIFSLIFKLYYNPKIIGKENIPKKGPIIIAGNHKHLFDQCLAILSTKRPIHYMAKKEYFEGRFAFFFKSMGCIRVNRDGNDKLAKEKALEILNNNKALGIFPEGTRNKTNKPLLPFKFGAVSLAKKTKAYIVPFAITGDYKFRSKNLTIRFSKPFKVSENLEEANNYLKTEILNLIRKNN